MILCNKGITKKLIRLRGCAGWSAPLLFAHHRRQVLSRRGPIDTIQDKVEIGEKGNKTLRKRRLRELSHDRQKSVENVNTKDSTF